jgi:hypothetical protein
VDDVTLIAPPVPPVDATEVEEGVEAKVEHLLGCVLRGRLEKTGHHLCIRLSRVPALDECLWFAHIWIVGRSSQGLKGVLAR